MGACAEGSARIYLYDLKASVFHFLNIFLRNGLPGRLYKEGAGLYRLEKGLPVIPPVGLLRYALLYAGFAYIHIISHFLKIIPDALHKNRYFRLCPEPVGYAVGSVLGGILT